MHIRVVAYEGYVLCEKTYPQIFREVFYVDFQRLRKFLSALSIAETRSATGLEDIVLLSAEENSAFAFTERD